MKKLLCLLMTAVLLLSTVVVTFHAADVDVKDEGVGIYRSIPALNISRVVQSGDRDCHWCSMLTMIGYVIGDYSYNSYSTNYRKAGTDYSSYNDALSQKYKIRSASYYADSDLSIFPVKLAQKTRLNTNSDSTYEFFYNQLKMGRPLCVYSGTHASVIIGYKENSSKTLDSSGFIMMEVKKDGSYWSNSTSYYNTYANNPQVDGAASPMTCYVTFKSWLSYTKSSSTLTSVTYPLEYVALQPEDIGSDFYAHITTSSNPYLAVSADNTNNVLLSTLTYSNYQEWRFQKDSDNAYKITNVKTGTCLDVKGGKAEKGTNIQVYNSNNSSAQRWYILKNEGGYRLVPKVDPSTTMDIQDGTIASGTNIQIWNNQNTSDAQRFSITKTLHPSTNLGQRFTANIISSKSDLFISANTSGNVFIDSASGDGYQEWIFERQEDNSYEIKNVKLNKCLDVYNRDTANGTNIQVYNDNNSMAQRWYLVADGTDYCLVPKINVDGAIDITGNNMTEGTNIQEYKRNNSDAQKFYLDYLDCNPDVLEESNGHRYEYYDLNTTWHLAEKFCERKGGHLVTITSEEENELVHSIINKSAWLGGSNYGTDTKWYFVNNEPMTYQRWKQSEPTNGSEHYMMMYYSGDYAKQWNDVSETYTTGFVCEYDDLISLNSYVPLQTVSVDGKSYEVYEESTDWQTAKKICEKKGGSLVVIDSDIENNTIKELIQCSSKKEFWIGITDIDREAVWKNVFGDAQTYTNWNTGEPNNGLRAENYCIIKKDDGKWNDTLGIANQFRSIGFICEYDYEKSIETTAPSEPQEEETVEPPIPTPTEPVILDILGDADGDGEVTAVDVAQVTRACAHINTGIDKDILMNADVDGNGILEVIDATHIQRYLARQQTPYAIGHKK